MTNRAAPLLAALLLACPAFAALPAPGARLGVVDALPARLSAAFGTAVDRAPAPTVRDDWQLGRVATGETVQRLVALGYQASAVTLPRPLATKAESGGALQTGLADVRLDERFSRELADWMKHEKLDGVVLVRSLARPLTPGGPVEAGHGIARRGDGTVAYANLAPLLISGATPRLDGAPQCLVTTPVERGLVEKPKSLAELAPLGPKLKDVLRRAVDGALVRTGVMQGDAACE
ncbi:MAG: hypothetical protein J0H15_14170 [Xanthomonadales bacterium]|nr:hypothetical protein [Xanthomonadales bacterium]